MIKQALLLALTLVLVTSCVSPKVYKDLQGRYDNLKTENRKLSEENEDLLEAKNKAQNALKKLQKQYDETVARRDQLQKLITII